MMNDARKLLTELASAKRCAVCVKESADDDLPGPLDGFVLLYPDGNNIPVSDVFMRQAALIFCLSQHFMPGLSPPKPTHKDLTRASKLLIEMRKELRTRNDESRVIAPKNWKQLACVDA